MTKKGSPAAGRLLLIGFTLYVVSWFTPSYRQLGPIPIGESGVALTQTFGNMPERAVEAAMEGPDWLPGWTACRAAFHMLVDEPAMPDDHGGNRRLAGASCLSNLGMLAALLLLLTRSKTRMLGVALLAVTALNASWLYLPASNPFGLYRAGYYLWLVSFPLVGVGALLLPPRVKGRK